MCIYGKASEGCAALFVRTPTDHHIALCVWKKGGEEEVSASSLASSAAAAAEHMGQYSTDADFGQSMYW